MLNRTVSWLLAAFFLVASISCSSLNQSTVENPSAHVASGFSLSVLDDTYFNGSSADKYTLTVNDYGEEVVVDINVEGAQDIKALFAQLEYDAQAYRPMTGEPGSSVGTRDDLLVLSVLSETGVVHYNQILKNPDWRTGYNGDGLLAQVSFKKEPALEFRTVSTPPTAADSATILVWDNVDTLTWAYYSTGDYDQNSEVGAADLVPIAQHFGESNTPDQFLPTTIQSVIDGDHNTEIGSADLVPIAQNFGFSSLGGYNIYHSANAADAPDAGTLLDNLGQADADNIANIATERLQYTYVVSAPVANDYYWVRPSDGTTDGTPSNVVGGNPADAPQLALTNPPGSGSGSNADPYIVDVSTDYVFTLTDPSGPTDVSVDANTTWTVSAAGAGTVVKGATAVLNIEDAYTGLFSVSATYNAVPCNPAAIWLQVSGGGGGDVDIYPDPADTDWGDATGAGTQADPYVLDNTDYTTVTYGLAADDDTSTPGPSGNALNNGDLTWSAFPPFIVTWDSSLPPFQANQFTSGYVFAQDGSANNSNFLYVEIHSLPSS